MIRLVGQGRTGAEVKKAGSPPLSSASQTTSRTDQGRSVSTTRVVRNIAEKLLPERVCVHLQAYDHLWHGEPELALLKRVCPPQRIAVDVGANIGTYTYFLRRLA